MLPTGILHEHISISALYLISVEANQIISNMTVIIQMLQKNKTP